MAPKKDQNRRKHVRVSLCRLVKIGFSKLTKSVELANIFDLSESGLSFHVTDLSSSGFQISAPGIQAEGLAFKALGGIKKADTLFFRLKLDPNREEVSVLGKVAWVTRKPTPSGLRLRAGIQFVDLAEEDLKLIQLYISAFQS